MWLGKKPLNAAAIADKIAAKVHERHAKHNHTHEAPESCPAVQEPQLQHTIAAQKRKLARVEGELSKAQIKVAKGECAQKSQTERVRQESRAEKRRVEIDPSNKEPLSATKLSTAKLSEGTGIMDTVKYWARGSAVAVLQLVMILISSFGLESEVAAELGAQLDETNQYIVNRAKNSLQILKQCRTEEQRQHFRIVLTALAPTKADARDNAGIGRRVAEALDVNRNRATFRDSVGVRAEIDQAATVMNKPLIVGDSVVCRHNQSVN